MLHAYISHSPNSFDRNLNIYVAGNGPAREMFLTALPLRKMSFPDLPPLNCWKFESQAHLGELWRKRRPKQGSQIWQRGAGLKHMNTVCGTIPLFHLWEGTGLSLVWIWVYFWPISAPFSEIVPMSLFCLHSRFLIAKCQKKKVLKIPCRTGASYSEQWWLWRKLCGDHCFSKYTPPAHCL